MSKVWFKAKRYGWGWYPATWQGWVVLLLFIMAEVCNFLRLDAVSHSNSDTIRPFVIETFGLVTLLLIICYLTGEPPRWRWGKD